MPSQRSRLSGFHHFVFFVAEGLIAFSLVGIFFSKLLTFEFGLIASILFPLIIGAFTFASLLYNRSRAYSSGRVQIRSLVAAERAMQGAFYFLTVAMLGAGMYSAFLYAGFQPITSASELQRKHGWLLLFLVPMFMLIPGFVQLRKAIQLAAVDFLGVHTTREIRKRVRSGTGK